MKKRAAVFGTGFLYQNKKNDIKKEYHVDVLLDNKVPKGEQWESDERKCINPIDYDFQADVIIICSMMIGEMTRQIIELGAKEEDIVFAFAIEPTLEYSKLFKYGKLVVKSSNIYFDSKSLDVYERVSKVADLEKYSQMIERKEYSYLEIINNLPKIPISSNYATERGQSIVRYYIESYLGENSDLIRGDVLEIGDRRYSDLFKQHIGKSYCMSVMAGEDVFFGDLSTGEGIQDNLADCIILTQVLPFIFDIREAARNIVRLLKSGGVALITVHGISQIIVQEYNTFGDYWRMTDSALKKLFSDIADVESIVTNNYGNIRAAVGFLYGLAAEDFGEEILNEKDNNYPVIVTAIVKKK